jgi:hypothetical protein
MAFLVVLAILLVVVFVVTTPLRRAGLAAGKRERDRAGEDIAAPDAAQAELEAARAAKYREIRDAELDHRTGKLSDEDYEAVDRVLRAEAVEILRAIDRAEVRVDAPADHTGVPPR